MSEFRFKQFSVKQDRAALKVGTDAVLLGTLTGLEGLTGIESQAGLDGLTGETAELLDIGTGTGVISLIIAQRLAAISRDWHISAIDIDGPSILDAADNFYASPWPEHLQAIHSSLQEFSNLQRTSSGPHGTSDLQRVPSGHQEFSSKGFDLIFSNPPFYDDSLRNPDPREANARHSASLSYRDIIAFAAEYLRKPSDNFTGGRLSLILPAEEETRLLRTAASFDLFPFRIVRIRTVEKKKPRRIVAEFRIRGPQKPELREETLTLQGPDSAPRSEEYQRLTEDFYL